MYHVADNKESPYAENILNENRIFNIPLDKGQFHLCGPSKQIMPHYQEDSLFLFEESRCKRNRFRPPN
jgi:hypothetical protein